MVNPSGVSPHGNKKFTDWSLVATKWGIYLYIMAVNCFMLKNSINFNSNHARFFIIVGFLPGLYLIGHVFSTHFAFAPFFHLPIFAFMYGVI